MLPAPVSGRLRRALVLRSRLVTFHEKAGHPCGGDLATATTEVPRWLPGGIMWLLRPQLQRFNSLSYLAPTFRADLPSPSDLASLHKIVELFCRFAV